MKTVKTLHFEKQSKKHCYLENLEIQKAIYNELQYNSYLLLYTL